MPDHCLYLDLHGTPCVIQADRPEWIRYAEPAFDGLIAAADETDRSAFRIDIRERQPGETITPTWPLTYAGQLPDGHRAEIYQSGDDLLIVYPDGSFVTIWQGERRVEARVSGDGIPAFFGTALMTAVDAALFTGNQQLVHAAALIDPADGGAVLFFVPSGGGKTTTSLALARGGFGIITDDASVLQQTDAGFMVWGMPRALKVHHRTADLLPWLTPPSPDYDKNGEQAVPLDVLDGLVALAPYATAPLKAIVVIGPRRPEGHRIDKASRAEVLIALAHDNIGVAATGLAPKAATNYRRLASIVQQVPLYKLSAGTDLASLPDVVSAALAGGVAAGPAQPVSSGERA